MDHSTRADDHARPTPDIRRRRRVYHGVPFYTVKVLIELLRLRGKFLRGARIALIGFETPNENADEIRTILLRHGARISAIETGSRQRKPNDELIDALRGADGVIIASDHPLFRAMRPREFRELGIDIVVPTTLRE